MTPLVTVIIPTYNRSQLLPRAIESVCRQTHSNVEILVVDDGSPDDTESVVRAIDDNRIRYVRHEVNRGLPAARNTGIKSAQGHYIAFLDDDDEWRDDKLAKQLAIMGQYDAVFSGALTNGLYVKLHRRANVSAHDLRSGNKFPPSTLLVRTAAIRDIGFDERLCVGEDWDAYIRLVQKYRIGYVPEPLLLLNDGAHQRITNSGKNMTIERLEARTAVIEKHREFFGGLWYRRHLAMTLLSYFWHRQGKLKHLVYAVKRCGIVAVASALLSKVCGRVKILAARSSGARRHSVATD